MYDAMEGGNDVRMDVPTKKPTKEDIKKKNIIYSARSASPRV